MSILDEQGRQRSGRDRLVLIVAPFDRGLEFGGSQRATSLAEALEARGFSTEWWKVSLRTNGMAARLKTLVVGPPDVVQQYDHRLPDGAWDVVIAEHSFLAPSLEYAPSDAVRVVDFQNLESEQLRDVAAGLRPPQRWFYLVQAARMASFEASVVRSVPLACFTGNRDLARSNVSPGCGIIVPNQLPRATTEAAERVWVKRRQRKGGEGRSPILLYVGKLDFLPNLMGLRRFLTAIWPSILREYSDPRLFVAGKLPPNYSAELAAPNVEVLGYVDDLEPLLVECTAAVMPLTNWGGTSLRVLWYALAGIPMIGTQEAFRGFDASIGLVAATPDDWVNAVRVCIATGPDMTETARDAAARINGDREPWDRLAAVLLERIPRR